MTLRLQPRCLLTQVYSRGEGYGLVHLLLWRVLEAQRAWNHQNLGKYTVL